MIQVLRDAGQSIVLRLRRRQAQSRVNRPGRRAPAFLAFPGALA
ncbi:hypothetical protein ACS15_4385 [Ralstonia insidiosa]|uniref:Uncharacterized protein n=1 Tax=Ralstonia insidiosa TaxID=190721 RepID=A0AAC9BLL0_9RALS|nr:hypothetical protein ACS15_4385 [Ralstonia insidiosa]